MQVAEISISDPIEISPDLSAYPLDDELVVYDARRDRTYVLNASGRHVFEACASAGTLAEAARSLSEQSRRNYDDVLSDVLAFTVMLGDAGLLAASGETPIETSPDDARFEEEEAVAAAWRFRKATEGK